MGVTPSFAADRNEWGMVKRRGATGIPGRSLVAITHGAYLIPNLIRSPQSLCAAA
jgi:hypothetical protein